MKITSTEIADVKLIEMSRHGDPRGFFSEVYNRRLYHEAGIDAAFVQDNFSLSATVGTVRGLHFQLAPHAQAKLVWVSRGRIFDVVVDLREGSPTRGRWVSAVLSAEAWNQFYIPAGFAHGFCTLEPDCCVQYKVSGQYAPECDRGVIWNDPELGIAWPVTPDAAVLSDKDRRLPRLAELGVVFPVC
ncbi:MAG: dTDP-4-dehydrorhamnose 3,5-epimerase [Rhodospirillaceae bacterium]